MLRISDPKTGEVVTDAAGRPEIQCVDVPVSETLCGLANAEGDFTLDTPARDVRVEVAVWQGGQLAENDIDCEAALALAKSADLFTVGGQPQAAPQVSATQTVIPQMALGGAAFFQAGDTVGVEVQMHCPNYSLLESPECPANRSSAVVAEIKDITTMSRVLPTVSDQIGGVSVGRSEQLADDVWTYNPIDDLEPDSGGGFLTFEQEIDERLQAGEVVCLSVAENTPQTTPALHCQRLEGSPEAPYLEGYLVRKTVVDAALAALGLEDFPEEGLVIGRVVDETLSPTSGVVVTPPTGSVIYLSDDLTSTTSLTSNSGYFVATDTPFFPNTPWTASHFDGRRQSGRPLGGLVRQRVTAVIIRLEGETIGD